MHGILTTTTVAIFFKAMGITTFYTTTFTTGFTKILIPISRLPSDIVKLNFSCWPNSMTSL